MFQVAAKLKNVKKNIKKWNKHTFGNIFENKKKILEELKDIQDRIQTDGYEVVSREEESVKLVEFHDIITKEEMFWRQRSRKVFLKEGDRNTKFFHMTTLKHRMANIISRLKIEERFIDNEEIIKREAMDFFSNLLQGDPNLDLDKQNMFLDCIPSYFFEDQNNFLTSINSSDDISKVFFSFEGDKAPDLDAFPFFSFISTRTSLVLMFVMGLRNFLALGIFLKR